MGQTLEFFQNGTKGIGINTNYYGAGAPPGQQPQYNFEVNGTSKFNNNMVINEGMTVNGSLESGPATINGNINTQNIIPASNNLYDIGGSTEETFSATIVETSSFSTSSRVTLTKNSSTAVLTFILNFDTVIIGHYTTPVFSVTFEYNIGVLTTKEVTVEVPSQTLSAGIKTFTYSYNMSTGASYSDTQKLFKERPDSITCNYKTNFKSYKDAYIENGVTQTSTREVKKEILPLSLDYLTFTKSLSPVSFKFKDGTSNRTHTGFIVDEVKDALDSAGLTSQDFAGYILSNPDDPNSTGGLRYTEFIPLLLQYIQHLESRIEALETK